MKGTTKKNTSQKERFIDFLRSLRSVGLPLMKNVISPLAKSVLVLLGLMLAAPVTDAAIQNKILGSGTTALIISTDWMKATKKIVKSLEESRLLIKRVNETIKNETKEQKKWISLRVVR